MEAVLNLKRGSTTDLVQCIVCQEKTWERVSCASEKGLVKLKESAQERQKHRDATNRAAIERISSAFGTDPAPLVWHKSCYSTFTSPTHISRVHTKMRLHYLLPVEQLPLQIQHHYHWHPQKVPRI